MKAKKLNRYLIQPRLKHTLLLAGAVGKPVIATGKPKYRLV